ncbi:restriction endonuclease [Parapedobacter indicus]|uniref:Restriction endonuclease n=1 Tax=Parapedobacter indicus TaxID=1477437 RepID=A0A1I3UI23_9SPHI|nr:restriction endonuclease [Parapedobacter indicus]PPK99317.1 restriction endonuclease [Parapedobacter indicus]SFJ82582.1 Restriction endonuclease [Parapedobacter indicus]
MNYHLEVLNDKEFEQLSKDLLEKVLGIPLQNFKTGKDGGIDLRYSSHIQNDIIIQAKAYTKSNYANLRATMNKEKVKMNKLSPSPKRYILTTTCALSPKEVDEIMVIMNPYILSTQDIYGRDRIESLISGHHDIEKKYYKLWLTSTNILETILHNGQRSQSEFFRDKVLKKASIYVPTKNLQDAIDKLNENKFVIISGEPGVGKTTIAYILICDLLSNGYELINIDDKISDALNLLSLNPDIKQVFFFDDFLGANINEILNPKNTESKIINFIEQIESSKNKFLILTSRTTILNQAKDNYEHFARQKFDRRSKYELRLNEYSLLNKAKIVYNHLYFNDISKQFKSSFFENKNYLKIVEHKNYFPRLIEFITSQHNYDPDYYKSVDEFIFKNLANPTEIWKVAFERQLEDEDRFLLFTLFSFAQPRVRHEILEHAFDSRYRYEIKENGIQKKIDPFNRALKKTLGSFITSVKVRDGVNEYQLLNPSIADFLLNYIRDSTEERNRILFSIGDIDQLTGYFDIERKDKIVLTRDFLKSYYPVFINCLHNINNKELSFAILNILYCFDKFFNPKIINDHSAFLTYFQKLIKSEYKDYISSSRFITILENIPNNYPNEIKELVISNWSKLMLSIIKNAYGTEDLASLENLHELYSMDLAKSIENEKINEEIGIKINSLFDDYVKDYEVVVSESDVLNTYHDSDETYTRFYIEDKYWDSYSSFFFDCGLNDYYDNFNHELDINSEEILDKILKNYSYEEDDYRSEAIVDEDYSREDEIKMIEDLFEE